MLSLTELSEGLRIATRALKANRMRTVLTTLGIFIGVIVVTVIISVIQGLNHYVSGQISGLGADTIYIDRFPWLIRTYEEYLKYQKRKDLTEEHYLEVLKQATLASAVAPEIESRRTIKYRNESLDGVTITGTSDAYMQTANVMPEVGRFFTSSEVDFNRNVCVIGYEVADKLFNGSNPLEKTIKIGPTPFLVVGVLEKRGQMFGFSMDNTAIVPYTAFLKAFGSRRSFTIDVKARDPALTDDMIDQLIGIMRRERGLGADRPDDFSINQQSQLLDFYKSMTKVLWIVLIGIGSISLLIGGIGIMNIMLVSVTERTHEIGIRKALGAKNRVILWQFLVESMFISSIGVTLGIIFSVLIASIIRSVSPIPVNISAWVLFLGVGFTVAIGLFFGLYPASKAAQLDPIVALRQE